MDLAKHLRADLPALEPDPVLLAQLVQLSTVGAPVPAARTAHGARVAFVSAGAAAIVGGTAWLAGALPGTVSPLPPFRHHHPLPSQHSSQPALRNTSTPTAPGTAGSSGVPEGWPSTGAPSGSASPSAHPTHPSHPVHPTQPVHPSHPAHPTTSAHPHTNHPKHPAHPTKHRAHPSPRTPR